jgi:hypothetical protein
MWREKMSEIVDISNNLSCEVDCGSFFIMDQFKEDVEVETVEEAIKLIAELEKFIEYKTELEENN